MLALWHIDGEDIHMRIPLLLAMKDKGFSASAVGSEDGTVFREYDVPYFCYSLSRSLRDSRIKILRDLYCCVIRGKVAVSLHCHRCND